MSDNNVGKIDEVPFQDELGEAFARYAEKIILDRAIPDVRDGLKPVHRRIIYAMYESKNTADKPYRKSAKTVGDVMGNYHPHGDSSIYDALVRLAQPWKMRYPLIDGHGNFGSMDDDPAAAMRYTEARLAPIAVELMTDIDKDTVPWRPNFDEKTLEPVVLPAGFLNLLINGSSGVSAGFATNIPSHNLGEVIDAALAVLKRPSIGVDALLEYVPGPDFATGGILMGREGIKSAYETGKGKVVLRGRHHIEPLKGGKSLIVFTEIPFQVVKSDLVRQMDALRLERAVQGIVDVRDETDREGLRLVVELATRADVDGVLAYLMKKTDIQVNFHINMVTICRNTPMLLGLKPILEAFVEHRRNVVRRRSLYDVQRAEKRLHEVEGLIRALDALDEIIARIRRSKDRTEARASLMEMDFSEHQANAILDLRLVRLCNLEILQLTEESKTLSKLIADLRKILDNPKHCDKIVGNELKRIKKLYDDPRRTTLEDEVEKLDIDVKVTVKDVEAVVGVTRQGWIKWSSLASFVATGGTRKSSGVRPGDRMQTLVETRTVHRVLVFASDGMCYPVPVHQIPESKWGEAGTSLVNVCGIASAETFVDLIATEEFHADQFLVFVTAQGAVKATSLAEFDSRRSAGIAAMGLAEGDTLARVILSDRKGEMLLLSHYGQGIRFGLDEISVQGRSAKGVRGMRVNPRDSIRDVATVESGSDPQVAIFTRSGRAKLTPYEQFPKQRRGGKGVRMIISRVKNRHECIAFGLTDSKGDGFEVVDSNGIEHYVESAKIPVTRRDGNAWNVVPLADGALVTLVEHVPPVAPADDTAAKQE